MSNLLGKQLGKLQRDENSERKKKKRERER